jgi:hypothetical protein
VLRLIENDAGTPPKASRNRNAGVEWGIAPCAGREIYCGRLHSGSQGLGRGRGVGRDLGVALGVAVPLGVGVTVAVAVGVGVTVGVGGGVEVGVAVAVAVGVGVAVGVTVGVVSDCAGAWILTEIGEPVLKNPMFAVLSAGGAVESNRKLYNVPKRIALAFWFSTNVWQFQVADVKLLVKIQGVLLYPASPWVPSWGNPGC